MRFRNQWFVLSTFRSSSVGLGDGRNTLPCQIAELREATNSSHRAQVGGVRGREIRTQPTAGQRRVIDEVRRSEQRRRNSGSCLYYSLRLRIFVLREPLG